VSLHPSFSAVFFLFCGIESCFKVNSRQMGLSNKPVSKRSTSLSTVATMKDNVVELNVIIGRYEDCEQIALLDL